MPFDKLRANRFNPLLVNLNPFVVSPPEADRTTNPLQNRSYEVPLAPPPLQHWPEGDDDPGEGNALAEDYGPIDASQE
jgi:hypothetical protein